MSKSSNHNIVYRFRSESETRLVNISASNAGEEISEVGKGGMNGQRSRNGIS